MKKTPPHDTSPPEPDTPAPGLLKRPPADGGCRITDDVPQDAPQAGVAEYITALRGNAVLASQITCHTVFPPVAPVYGEPARPWPKAVSGILEAQGIPALYKHQAEASDALRAGRSVVTATPTASGKSLVYTLPVLERFLRDPDSRSLFLFPLKALAQDQLAAFRAMTAHWPESARPLAAVYDGDTTPHFRKKIRENPPHVLLTNPEMLHLSLLPHHPLWTTLFAGLSFVVVDEAHTYRGVLGSHMAQLFRRLRRIAALYGSRPVFSFCSATVGNPADLATRLTGEEPVPVLESGAPQGKRHYVFINPLESPAGTAIKLLKAALHRQLRTIVYCQSRRMTELISLWVAERSGPYKERISAYRAGFLPEERRDIEGRMASGELLAVISTSALELGIDIGNLDLCILVGYPGTVTATLQRGGRVGRSAQESAVLLIAREDALDQYIVRHPREFFSRPPEHAVLNPDNPVILERHLECAAAELPLRPEREPDKSCCTPEALRRIEMLERRGILLRSADGGELFAARKRPQRHVSLRGSGGAVAVETEEGELIGSVDGVRALREAHPGAIYLHMGRYFTIEELDLPGGRALAKACRPTWYTRTRSCKETEILSMDGSRSFAGMAVQRGRLRITDTVTGYEKRANKNGQLLGVVPLALPPQVFETDGFWFLTPPHAQAAVENARMHFMGAIHALEHAAIGILPLLVMADRNDFGGISTPMHLQTARPTVFVYDGMPGGAGLCREAFERAEELFAHVRSVIADCPCESGCPSCVHSPKCGSGNRPIDKEGALALLEAMLDETPEHQEAARAVAAEVPGGLETGPRTDAPGFSGIAERPASASGALGPPLAQSSGGATAQAAPEFLLVGDSCAERRREAMVHYEENGETMSENSRFVVVDVETRLSAAEVGGWHRADRMGISIAVVYDSLTDSFTSYTQEEIPRLAEVLGAAPLVVGFNLLRFDYKVLQPHAPQCAFAALPTLDLLVRVHEQLSYRLSLDNLAGATLGSAKGADGLQALAWWKEGRLDLIEAYCRQDVALTRDLYLYGKTHGHLLFTNKAGQKVRVRAEW